MLVGAPRFEEIRIELGNDRILQVRAPGAAGGRAQFISSARWRGEGFSQVWLDWERLKAGGALEIGLSDASDNGWGAGAGDVPAAACPATR